MVTAAAPVGVPRGMADMIDVTVSTKINRSADVVFAYMSNIANAPSWRTDVMEVSQTSAGPIGAGATFHLRMKPAMGVSEADLEVAECKPNTKLVLTINLGRFKSTHTGQFTAAGEATIYTEQIQVSMGGLMRLMEPLAKGMVRRSNARVLENLKRVLEQG